MIIKVDSINNGFSKEIECEGNVSLPNDKEAFAKIKGEITNSYSKYILTGNVYTKIEFECNSCLENFQKEFNFHITEIFSKESSDDDEIWIFSAKDNIIKLNQPIIANILLNLPMKALCSEKCMGLCQICGQNLNESSCNCDRGFIDPRFEKILTFFENKEV